MWYAMQSSQRSTIDATRPSSSLVLAQSAPPSYVFPSRVKNRLVLIVPPSLPLRWASSPRMRQFIFERNSWNCSYRPMTKVRNSNKSEQRKTTGPTTRVSDFAAPRIFFLVFRCPLLRRPQRDRDVHRVEQHVHRDRHPHPPRPLVRDPEPDPQNEQRRQRLHLHRPPDQVHRRETDA